MNNKDCINQGLMTALVTPMKTSGEICVNSFIQLLAHQEKYKVDGIVLFGTTGEGSAVTYEERAELIQLAKKHTSLPVFVGATSNITGESIRMAHQAQQLGADGLQIATPYYNNPTQDGLYQHFSAIASETDLPIMLYSNKGRCGIEFSWETVKKLKDSHQNFIGLKESGGSPMRVSELIHRLGDFPIFSGDDGNTLSYMALGARGLVSVAANLIPGELKKMVHYALDNHSFEAMAIHRKFHTFFRDQFIESNPIPIKYALWQCGLIDAPTVRLPLCTLSEPSAQQMSDTLNKLKLYPENVLQTPS